MPNPAAPRDCITAVPGVIAGHFTDTRRPTGCSVVIAPCGAVGGVDVRGAAPGTRETDLLAPGNLVERVHAVLLAGGSAWGLDAAGGVMRWLEARGIGLPVGDAPGQCVPIVPAAVLFDLHVGDARIRPDAAAGFAACAAASGAPLAQGSVGAGAGATVGKLFGMARAMKGGIGSAAVRVPVGRAGTGTSTGTGTSSAGAPSVTVGALVAVNAVGDVVDPATGRPIAGARTANGLALGDSVAALLAGAEAPTHPLAGRNTTIGVLATDAPLSKAQCQRLAGAGHDGLARAVRPVHTMSDGDTLFALATGEGPAADLNLLCVMAAQAVTLACVRAVLAAESLTLPDGRHWPAARDWRASGA